MHISEGVLAAPVLIAGAGLAAAGTAIGLSRMDYDALPRVGLLGAAFFVASLIHVPIGASSVHLLLNGLCGLLLGWMAVPAILVGLTLQAVLFQFGGLTVLGVNTFLMGTPAVLLGVVCQPYTLSRNRVTRALVAFACGAGSILLAALGMAGVLALTGQAYVTVAKLVALAHVPVMVVEGILTVFCVEFLRKVKPEMLGHMTPSLSEEPA
jgi:cobalt/nickel transport system permease protein